MATVKTFIGNVKGSPGETPHVGTNGNWWIGQSDTGVHAQGEKGDRGDGFGRNLLHNRYFANCVNQRGQTAYTGISYTIDRWKILTDNTTLTIVDSGVRLYRPSGENVFASLGQYIENPEQLYGKTVTASVLMSDGSFATATGTIPETPPAGSTSAYVVPVKADVASDIYFGLFFFNDGHMRVHLRGPGGTELTFAAVKLELGDTQTLAHQDTAGNWLLNEIPDYGEELIKCQRYYQIFSSEAARPKALADYRPNMRATPATGTIDIGGVTHYYADANL